MSESRRYLPNAIDTTGKILRRSFELFENSQWRLSMYTKAAALIKKSMYILYGYESNSKRFYLYSGTGIVMYKH